MSGFHEKCSCVHVEPFQTITKILNPMNKLVEFEILLMYLMSRFHNLV